MIELEANQRLSFETPGDFWIVEEGKGELFIKEKKGGALTHLESIRTAEFIFGFPADEAYEILLITNGKTRLSQHKIATYSHFPQNAPKVLRWLHILNPFYEIFGTEAIDVYLKNEEKVALQKGKKLSAMRPHFPEYRGEIRWITVTAGLLALFNLEAFKLTPTDLPYPLTHSAWAQTLSDSAVTTLSSDEVLSSAHFPLVIATYQAKTLEILKKILHLQAIRDKKQTEERLINDATAVQRSLYKIGSILSEKEPFIFSPRSSSLFKACHILSKKMDMRFIEPKELSEEASQYEKIQAICLNSKVGFREVTLETGWWKKDSLCLLGFYGEEKKPVALVDKKGGDYVMIDPDTGAKRKMDKEVAAALHTKAFAFYPPFPEKTLSGWDILRFTLKRYKSELFSLLAIGIGGALLSLSVPILTMILFNKVIATYENPLLPHVIFAIVAAVISIAIFLFVRSYAVARLMQLVELLLDSAIWQRLLSLPVNFFRKFTVGNLIQRASAVAEIRVLIGGNTIRVLFSLLFSFFYYLVMLYMSPHLTFYATLTIGFGMVISGYFIFKKLPIQRELSELRGNLDGTVVQLITGVSKIRLSGAEARAFDFWAKDFTKYQTLVYRSRYYDTIINSFVAFLALLTTGVLFIAVAYNPLPIGTFIGFLAAFSPFSMAVFEGITLIKDLAAGASYWEKARVIFETQPESYIGKEKPGKLLGEIRVDHVSFQYEKEAPLTLNDVSFYAHPGEFVALVGPSGSGKSTLIRLLLSFEAPLTGSIYYDGKELTALDLLEVRRQIGTVLQHGSLFSGSIYENIVCGGIYSHEEVLEALQYSGFDKDLETFPMGLQTIVQSGGGTLSLGQAQRLLISRALVAKPRILIFDEATSALDNKTQEEVSRRLDEMEVTRIVIAHRLSTVRHATRIYVLDKGKIVQTGTFIELAQQEGVFKQMLHRQLL